MNTSKILLSKRRLNHRSIPYLQKKQVQSSSMQDRYLNWSCVLDPTLALSHYGVLVAENMRSELELWVVQELWNIVNNADFYSQRTELITSNAVTIEKSVIAAEVIWSLKEWEKIKQESDLSRLGMYWLGDNLQESLLPKDKPVNFFKQWQSLATALDKRDRHSKNDSDILNLIFRDTIALAASLKSAFILTYQPAAEFERNSSPAICKMLENWGIPCQIISRRNPIVAMERQYLRELIVRAGLGKLLLAGVHLAAFHLVIPAVLPSINLPLSNIPLSIAQTNNLQEQNQESYFWNNVEGVWYYL